MAGIKKRKQLMLFTVMVICMMACLVVYMPAAEKTEDDTIISGVFIGDIDVSGMTKEEARAAVELHAQELMASNVVMMVGENPVEVPVSELGLHVEAEDVYEEAVGLCKKGNIVKRFKDMKRLETEGMHYKLTYGFDEQLVRKVIEEKCTAFDQKAVNAGLKRTGSGFQITDGSTGLELDIEQSVRLAMDFLTHQWSSENQSVALAVTQTQPKGTREELSKVKDLLATATTSYTSSGSNRSGNVERGAGLINGTVLYPGEEFSTYQVVSPITIENGYFMAASYAEGQVVESPGGGICQVSTTLYNAVLKAELQVSQRSNHSMIVTYVDPAKDAAIAGTYKDLKFINNTEAPIYIEGITAGKKITFNIYGMETRSSSRTVEYVSETLKEIEPTTEIKADGSANFGSINSQSPHKGYEAKLWKVVKENGAEVSRTEVNTSRYAMTPRRYTVGTANASPEALAELQAAIGSQNLDAVKAVIGKYGSVNNNQQPTAEPDPGAADPNAPQPPADPNAGQQPADPNAGQQPADPNAGQQPADPNAGQQPADPNAGQQPADPNAGQQPADPNGQQPVDPAQ
ncbi:MAG: hypothetical protein HFI75_01630 [Lachnospiraceae bacterium]|nr:hypothetical protein [Lachnospiraceae bacterium]